MTIPPRVGGETPEFSLEDSQSNIITKADLIGCPAVIYFYPKDDTPGCTKEACAFRDSLDEFSNRGIQVFGVSADSPESHRRFQAKYHLPFTLLSDPTRQTIEAFGAQKETGGTKRLTYIIDPGGQIAAVFPNVDPAVHAQEILDWFSTNPPNQAEGSQAS